MQSVSTQTVIVVLNKHLFPLSHIYAVEFNILELPVHNDTRTVQTFQGLEQSSITTSHEPEAIMLVATRAQGDVTTDPTFSGCGSELSSAAVVILNTGGRTFSC